MQLSEYHVNVCMQDGDELIESFDAAIRRSVPLDALPIRMIVTKSDRGRFDCEVGVLANCEWTSRNQPDSIFRFVRRRVERSEKFTTVLLIPTGVGAEIGGHAGDGGPVAKLLGQVSDQIVVHPNVVNAADINEMPANALYVEGSVVCRLLMGTIGLQPVRSNRILVVLDSHDVPQFVNAAVNSVNAARTSYGLACENVVCVDPPLGLEASYTTSGRASGCLDGLDGLCQILDTRQGEFGAIAVSSVVRIAPKLRQEYFRSKGEMVNPWGGAEALLTHALSTLYGIPTAHSPMFESLDSSRDIQGVVDPRKAAEAVSMTFLQCTLKGLMRSPQIVTEPDLMSSYGVITVEDVSCLVIPDGCIGLPCLAALEQGIPVVSVRENRNVMRNNLSELPWKPGQLHEAQNYWEAAGIIAAMRAGISPRSVRRPLTELSVETLRCH